jgi:hypothetical protein
MPAMVVAVVVIAAKVAGVRLEAAAAFVEVAMETASESAAAVSASVEAAAAAYKGAAAKPAATATATMAAATAAAARIGANGRQGQSADHEKSGKRSFDRCTHDNLSFSAHQHCRCSRQK